jgi:hypothetical protein
VDQFGCVCLAHDCPGLNDIGDDASGGFWKLRPHQSELPLEDDPQRQVVSWNAGATSDLRIYRFLIDMNLRLLTGGACLACVDAIRSGECGPTQHLSAQLLSARESGDPPSCSFLAATVYFFQSPASFLVSPKRLIRLCRNLRLFSPESRTLFPHACDWIEQPAGLPRGTTKLVQKGVSTAFRLERIDRFLACGSSYVRSTNRYGTTSA